MNKMLNRLTTIQRSLGKHLAKGKFKWTSLMLIGMWK